MATKNRINDAAWVPETTGMGWDEAAAIGVDWIDQECARLGARALLLVESHASDYSTGSLGHFAGRNSVTTRLSRDQWRPGSGPVLVYVPSPDLLDVAISKARGSSLCAVEGFGFPLLGWAMESRATDLVTGEMTPDTRTEGQLELLEHLQMFANNAFGDSFAKQVVPRLLRELAATGIDWNVVLGTVVARGASARGVKHLRDYIRRL